ncbi:LysR family transcriptional regulator [Rhizorhabdus dicambivorans]|uniref:LysR family transcriptional regulator n=1 Tax=Rhizorhabdus dicambivorans TaxID=1850238 RepID=A0A2A4FQF9_9SPHN|nr:LysR family transcriptional regulator [Rhizorhabdus dicambivorans]ATE63764.1 LysR family transcriptional regulator [Rhizorhabdus dicambivorans]PCE40407.1 LysR family transcriptional regulator [Rhizorhabdus dicambivorans]
MSSWEGLEEIVAIAETGSFVGAARRLNVSPSHVSRIVQRLEHRLKVELFTRTTRTVRPTEMGRTLVDQSRRIIEERDEALLMVRGQGEMQGGLRLTCSTTLGERFVAPIIGRFLMEHPKISVTLELTNRVIDLVGEDFDVAIRTGHPLDQRLAARQIAARSVISCAAPDYIDRNGRPACPADLERHECLIGINSTWHFMEGGQRRNLVPAGRLRCNSGAAVVEAALAGMGICQLPAFYVRDHIHQGRLVAVLEDHADAPEPIWAVYPQRRYLLPKVQRIIAALEAELDDRINPATP